MHLHQVGIGDVSTLALTTGNQPLTTALSSRDVLLADNNHLIVITSGARDLPLCGATKLHTSHISLVNRRNLQDCHNEVAVATEGSAFSIHHPLRRHPERGRAEQSASAPKSRRPAGVSARSRDPERAKRVERGPAVGFPVEAPDFSPVNTAHPRSRALSPGWLPHPVPSFGTGWDSIQYPLSTRSRL